MIDFMKRWMEKLEVLKAFSMVLMFVFTLLTLPKPDGTPRMDFMEPYVSLMLNLLFLVLLSILLLHKKPEINFSKVVRNVLGGNIGSLFGITSFLIALVIVGWITDYAREGLYISAFTSFIAFLNTIILFMLLMPKLSNNRSDSKPKQRKVLIFALSKPSFKSKHQDVSCNAYEVVKALFEKYFHNRCSKSKLKLLQCCITNLEPPIKYIAYHKETVERIIVLVSEDSGKAYDEYFGKLTESMFKSIKRDVKLVKVGPLDFNDYYTILDSLHYEIRKLMRYGYKDEDLSFFISGGTSAVTSAIIVSAIREGRQVEYITQDRRNDLVSIDVNVLQVRRLSGEEGD